MLSITEWRVASGDAWKDNETDSDRHGCRDQSRTRVTVQIEQEERADLPVPTESA